MSSHQTLIADVYAAFNQRNIDAVFAFMAEDVNWPRASEGGRALGKDEIRAYWTRQWKESDPHVTPVEVIDRGNGQIHVRVHQVVRSIAGDVLLDTEVWHIYKLRNSLIERMDVNQTEPDPDPPRTSPR